MAATASRAPGRIGTGAGKPPRSPAMVSVPRRRASESATGSGEDAACLGVPHAEAEKAARNEERHGVSFEEACELFTTDAPVLEVYDVEHSDQEDRFKSIGPVARGLVLVVWTERSDDVTRIISARWATKNESRLYAEYVEDRR